MTPDADGRQTIRLRALRIFNAIVRLGSVTGAARAQGLSQPAASRLLAQLERDVGFELFHRDRGRLMLTADGLLLHQEVERALDNVDRVQSLARDISDFRVGHLRLVAPPSFLEAILPDMIERFLEQYPQVHVSIDSHGVEVAKAMIASRTVNAGFVKLPHNRADLRTETVLVSESACVLPVGHPLAAEAQVTLSQTLDYQHIGLHEGSTLLSFLRDQVERLGRQLSLRIQVSSFEAVCRMIEAGVGIGVIPESAASRHSRTMRLAIVELDEPWAVRERSILVREYDALPGTVKALIAMLVPDRGGAERPPSA